MRAAVIDGPGKVEIRDLDVVPPAADEVLVRIEYCGVCGTDLHTALDGWAPAGTIGGHEWSGRIAEIGSAVTDVAVGDLIVGGPPWCGTCEWCVTGRPSLCVADPIRTNAAGHGGAFAEFHLARAATVHRVPVGLDARTAALSEPLAVALHGLTNADLPDDLTGIRILVSGAGPLGLLLIASLVDRGAANLTVSEPARQRRLASIAAGATTAVSPDDLPILPVLPTQTSPDGFDVVLETSGQAVAVSTGLSLLRPAGRLVLLGTGSMSVKLDAIRILLNELVVTGAYCYDATGIDDALTLLASGRLPIDALLGAEDYSLDGMLEMMKSLRAGEISRKALVRP